MINWKSLFFFLLTLTLIIGILCSAVVWSFNQGLEIFAQISPEVFKTPGSMTMYSINKAYQEQFKEYKDTDQGYSLLLPKGYKLLKTKEDPSITIVDGLDKWELTIKEKLLRYDDTIQSDRFINNPDGDYYLLLDYTLKDKTNPLLLFQKKMYLPSDVKEIKRIVTPHCPLGFLIVGESDGVRTEIYRMFDDEYWHNIFVTIYDKNYPHGKIETVIASLKNDIYIPPEEKEEKKFY